MPGFQKQVNLTPAPAVAGDFASSNPRATVLAGPGGLVAGSSGVTVGKFAWVAADGVTVNNTGTGAASGFVHREQQALITQYLAEASQVIPVGFPVTLHNKGDFWAVNAGPDAAAVGGEVTAVTTNGDVSTAAADPTHVATGYKFASVAAVGELVKISTWN
jgi:hypothetical protein